MAETADSDIRTAKREAALLSASFVNDGMRVGLGTGSTTALAIEELGRRVREDDLRIVGTPTSSSAELLARTYGVPVVPLNDLNGLDIAIDGADEVTPRLDLIKGAGGALLREKMVAQAENIRLGDPLDAHRGNISEADGQVLR